MLSQLELSVLRCRLGLASSVELRQVAKTAIDLGTYSPSLVEAAFDAEERVDAIGLALLKALQELDIAPLPESEDDCRWVLLRYYVSQMARGEIQNEFIVIEEMMHICNLDDREDDIYDLYSIYDAVYINRLNHPENLGLNLNDWRLGIVERCEAWLRKTQHHDAIGAANSRRAIAIADPPILSALLTTRCTHRKVSWGRCFKGINGAIAQTTIRA